MSLDNPLFLLLGLVLVDLCYYITHKSMHEVRSPRAHPVAAPVACADFCLSCTVQYNVLWSGHRVHHSSEHYNLSTALRQSWWQPLFSWLFMLPAALLLPLREFALLFQGNIIYQFWGACYSCLCWCCWCC